MIIAHKNSINHRELRKISRYTVQTKKGKKSHGNLQQVILQQYSFNIQTLSSFACSKGKLTTPFFNELSTVPLVQVLGKGAEFFFWSTVCKELEDQQLNVSSERRKNYSIFEVESSHTPRREIFFFFCGPLTFQSTLTECFNCTEATMQLDT